MINMHCLNIWVGRVKCSYYYKEFAFLIVDVFIFDSFFFLPINPLSPALRTI